MPRQAGTSRSWKRQEAMLPEPPEGARSADTWVMVLTSRLEESKFVHFFFLSH